MSIPSGAQQRMYLSVQYILFTSNSLSTEIHSYNYSYFDDTVANNCPEKHHSGMKIEKCVYMNE